MDALVTGGSDVTVMGTPAFFFFQRSEKVLMYWITANRSRSEISAQVGMGVPHRPWVTVMKRSASVGSEFFPGVERNLKIPRVKSRGLFSKKTAAGPLPSPFSPWQPVQRRS